MNGLSEPGCDASDLRYHEDYRQVIKLTFNRVTFDHDADGFYPGGSPE